MQLFEWTLALLAGAVALAYAARHLKIPYPVFLALGGAALSFVPGAPRVRLEPDLALALFVAPVLLDAAFDTSLRDLRENAAPVAGLVLGAVGATTAAVAVVAHALVPDMPWAAAVALGAVVAPPDAAAATAVLRHVAPPHRVLLILEGESLLNDASALLIYRLAVGAVAAGGFSLVGAAPAFLLVLVGSVVAGLVASRVIALVLRPFDDPPSAIILQFVGCFGLWLLAERLALSPILTVVVFAMAAARSSPGRTGAAMRVPSFVVWDTMVFLLNVLAFVLVGLQIGPILAGLGGGGRTAYLVFAGAVLATCIGARIVWVMGYNTVVRVKNRLFGVRLPRPMLTPSVGTGIAISWAGMRGIVTLAAALALPETFPYRDLIVLTAFVVVLGTLVAQGLTLRPLLLALGIRDDAPVEREVRLARVETARAGLAALDGDDSEQAEALKAELRLVCDGAGEGADGDGRTVSPRQAVRRRALEAQRSRLWDLRRDGAIGDAAYHRLETEFDLIELESGGESPYAT